MIHKTLSRALPIRLCVETAVLLAMLLAPVAMREAHEAGGAARMLSSILYTLPIAVALTALGRRWLLATAAVPLAVLSAAESVMVQMYGNYLIAGNLIAVATTTASEGSGFLAFALPNLWAALPALAACAIALTLHRRNRGCKRLLIAGFFAALAVAFLAYQLLCRYDGNITTRFYVEQNVLTRPPYNVFFQTSNALHQQRLRAYVSEADTMTFGATRPVHDGREAYALLVGESMRYANLSLAGYGRKTTPRLDTTRNLTLYTDYFSAANLTMYSVPQILTRATPTDFERAYRERGIYQPFRECGFKTFAVCCDNLLDYEDFLTRGVDSLFHVKDDSDIAPLVATLAAKYAKTFFVIEFFGNHNPYHKFPLEDNVFRPNTAYDHSPESDRAAVVNSYDNTVHYADRNLSAVIAALNAPSVESAMVFVSDHGEDFRPGTGGHGGNCRPNREEYHVPLLFWHSRAWAERWPAKRRAMLANRGKAAHSDNVFYTVLDMADISLPRRYARPEWSLLSPRLMPHERRLLVPDGRNTIALDAAR